MKRSTTFSITISLCVLVTLCGAQNNPYRASATPLRPALSNRDGQFPQTAADYPPQPPPIPALPPVAASRRAAASSPRAVSASRSDASPVAASGTPGGKKLLSEKDRDLLQKFDDYLFDNLEKAYYRLSFAFKDASKKTLGKCGCDAGTGTP